ncbi:hypothetical protein Afil01_52060 [Actinorhabdospora filicis]|uniref:Guanylate cyclase domain-containing protein n=1 Tax=Actinorhabdospora filicis TaxID=1785913 RepID=A0A9W6SP18_9ACTN|nr:adenylate/guanylate cyclase domain-containing protein [Actinorhabdospora filicis]GLZ80399.1 hypothetical protein Afil01_52060 [Actinorhabdospora filicis]
MTCPFCGNVVVPGGRYCHSCGAPLSPVASLPETERRVCTVLFGDLSDFTAWSEDLDPERVGVVTDRVLAVCAQAVTEHGGHVDKLTGDGIMAVFGAPVAHEDDAERAVRAAMTMQRNVRRVLDAEQGGGLPLGLRVGIRTGLVVAGMQASVEYTVIGDTVNTAARLADAAAVGTVYSSEETVAATKHVASWRKLEPLRLKGKRDPVPAYELLGLHDAPGTRTGLGDQAPFVGREAELGIVAGRLAEVVDRGEPRTLVLTAEAGFGKTRFGIEVGRRASSRGVRVVAVRAAAYGRRRRLGPLADLVRRAVGVSPDDDRATVAERLRRLAERHRKGDEPAPAIFSVDLLLALLGLAPAPTEQSARPGGPGPEHHDTEAMPAAVADLFNLLAAQSPLMLIVDDLHEATPDALDALGAAVARLQGPVLVLLLGRPELVRHAGVLTRISEAEAQTLPPLRGADAARLLGALCGGKLREDDEYRLLGAVQGNPYYLAELVALLTEQGLLYEVDGQWRLAPGSLTGKLVSTDLARVLAARIDALPNETKTVLRDAAVIGDTIPDGALSALHDHTDEHHLEELFARGMLRRRNSGGYRFVTPLMREAAYLGLAMGERAERHARLARWAAAGAPGGTLREDAADDFIATHATRALALADELGLAPDNPIRDVAGLAVAAYGRAAERAITQGEPAQAAALIDRSAELLPLSNGDRLIRGRALLRLDRPEDAMVDVEKITADLGLSLDGDFVAAIPGEPRVAALTLLLAGRIYRSLGEPLRAAAIWRAAGDLSERAELPTVRADVLVRLGMLDYVSGRLREAEARFTEALDVGRATGSVRSEAWALQHLAWVSTSRGDFDAADNALGQAARRIASLRDPIGRAWVRGTAAFTRLLAGRLHEAGKLATAFLPFGERVGDTWAVGTLRAVGAYAAAELGDLTDADTAARKAYRDFDRVDDDWGRGFALVVRAVVARSLAESDHARELALDAEIYGLKTGHPLLIGMARTVLGHCLLDAGDADGAERAALSTLELAVPFDVLESARTGPLALLAEAQRAHGDNTAALRLYGDIAAHLGAPTLLYPRRHAVARYADVLRADGRAGEALGWAKRAVDAPGEDISSKVAAQLSYAKALEATGSHADAVDAAEEAVRLTYSTEQRSHRAEAERLLEKLKGARHAVA